MCDIREKRAGRTHPDRTFRGTKRRGLNVSSTTSPTDSVGRPDDGEIMFAVDEDAANGPMAVIADVTTDDAWLSAPLDDSNTLSQWR